MEELNIQEKQNHEIAAAMMEQYGEVFFLKAEELNAMVAKINELIAALGRTVEIDGKLHQMQKHPDNSAAELEINDLAFNVLKGRKLMPVAKLTSGTGASSDDWSPVGSAINL